MRSKMYNQFLCSSFLLPEHRDTLNRHYTEAEQKELYIPSVDAQEQEQWEGLIKQSMKTGRQIRVTQLTGKSCRVIDGAVKKYRAGSGELILTTKNGAITAAVGSIVKVEDGIG